MLVKEKVQSRIETELQNLPEVEYPEEVVERWKKEAEIAKEQLAAKELVPKTAAELAAEWGMKIG
jgi:hypothetical protein